MAMEFFEKKTFSHLLIALIILNVVFLGLISSYAILNRSGVSCGAESYDSFEGSSFVPSSFVLDNSSSYVVQGLTLEENDIIYSSYSSFCFYANNSAPVLIDVVDGDLSVVGSNFFDSGVGRYCSLLNSSLSKDMLLGVRCVNCNSSVNVTLFESSFGVPSSKLSDGAVVVDQPLVFSVKQRSSCESYLNTLSNRFILFNGAFLFLSLLIYAINSFSRWVFDW